MAPLRRIVGVKLDGMTVTTVEAQMTGSIAVPDHLLTVEEWDALEETDVSKRFELVDGVVVVTPQPTPRHQLASRRLANALDGFLPDGLLAVHEVEIAIDLGSPPTMRSPDVVVVPVEKVRADPVRFDGADVVLAVEIISPGSRRVDRVMKKAEYEEVGIPSYWIIDPRADMERFVAYELRDGSYVEVVRGMGTLQVAQPVTMTLDVDALLCMP